MIVPLILKLKKAQHKEIARAQDIIVEELYNYFSKAVIHGGTAIWRCYQGNRFSEDVDVYIPKDDKNINLFFDSLQKRGLSIERKKISKNSIYSNLVFNRINVRFEALFKKTSGFLKDYETSDSNFITVYTLTPEDLIKEKVSAYLNRQKIRDLYDIFFLLRHIKKKEEIIQCLKNLIKNFKEPVDKDDLSILIIEGLVPDVKSMVDYIKRWIF